MPAAVAPVAPVAPAPVNGAAPTAPAAPATPEYVWEGKVDGEVKKFTKAELDRYVSKGAYADKLYRKSTEEIRQAQEIKAQQAKEKERLRKETEAYLRENEVDPEAFARQILERKVREGQMTPEQARAAQLEEENKALKAKQDEFDKAEEARKVEAQAAQLQKAIESRLAAAAKAAGIEQNAESFYAIYEALKESVELEIPFDAERIVEVAKENIEGGFSRLEKAVLSGLSGEALLNRLGPKVVDAVNKASIEKIRGRKAAPPAPTEAPAPVAKPSDYMTPAQADELVRKMGRK